jgi:hypothetical protein
MAGLGMVLGGALSGLGAGIAKQGEMDFEQRRMLALENTRQQNAQTNMRAQGEEQRTTQREKALLDDQLNENENRRVTSRTITLDKNRNALDIAKSERLAKVESQLRRTDAAAAETLKRETDAGQVSDTFQDDQGNWFVLYKNGSQKPLGVKGTPRTSGTAAAGGSPFEEALKNRGSGAQPATPGAKVLTPNW